MPFMFFQLIFLMTKIICNDFKETSFNDYYNLVANKNNDEIYEHQLNVHKIIDYSKIIEELFYEIDDHINDLKSLKEELEYTYIFLLKKNKSPNVDQIIEFFFNYYEDIGEYYNQERYLNHDKFLEKYQKELYISVRWHLSSFYEYSRIKFPVNEIKNLIEKAYCPNERDLKEVYSSFKKYCEILKDQEIYLNGKDCRPFRFSPFKFKSEFEFQVQLFLNSNKDIHDIIKKCRLVIAKFGHELFQKDIFFGNIVEKNKDRYLKKDEQCILS